MSYAVSERSGRFLGDTVKDEVHDLLYEVEGDQGCGVDRVLREGIGVGFFPDKLQQARMEGFHPCPKCSG